MTVATLEELELFVASTTEERAREAASLLSRLGGDWQRGDFTSPDGLACVHRPTQIEFVAVPGGGFDMGLSESDIEEASEFVDWVSSVARWVDDLSARARPVHRVHVRPFLVARQPLTGVEATRLGAVGSGRPTFTREVALRLAQESGFRLPSEAEFEWLAREGGARSFLLDAARDWPAQRPVPLVSRFGLVDLQRAHWVADDWHPDYEGAPAHSAAWMKGAAEGLQRGGFSREDMQDAAELLDALSAARFRGREPCVVRFAMDVPVAAMN